MRTTIMTETAALKRQFFHSLKRGTGEAYLIAKNNPRIDFSNYIIKGALHNYAYDGQSENSRAQYIFDLISLSNKKDKIRAAILKGISAEQDDTWSLTHLFDLTKLFAQQGDNEAKEAIYKRFLNNPIEGSDWVGYSEIIALDGFNGLIFIAEKFGKYIDKNPNDWQDDSIISHFQTDNPNIPVLQHLNKLSKSNKFIKLYLDCIKRTKENRKKHVREVKIFKNIIEEVLNSLPFLSFRRIKELRSKELNIIAKRLLIEKNKVNIEKLLDVFTSHKFPYDSNFILELAKQTKTSKNRINEYAIEALKNLKSFRIREFAIEKILKSKHPENFINILVSNYKKGDHNILVDIANKAKNDFLIERLAGSYVDIFRVNKTKSCKEPLEVLYYKMNCGIHRNSIIEVLMDNKVISSKIKKEIKYDSYLQTRELIK